MKTIEVLLIKIYKDKNIDELGKIQDNALRAEF